MALGTSDLSALRIIVPVRNGGDRWREAASALLRCVRDPSIVAVIDSSSDDGSDIVAEELGFEVKRIDERNFNHGRTRQEAVEWFCKGRAFAVFLTHDAVIEGPESLTELMSPFANIRTGAAYGRQLPHDNARPFARHNAAYLYPSQNSTRVLSDSARYGLRTTHLSNSFAAYRLEALNECGGFPSSTILGEDAYVAMRMLQSGWSISYRARATVRHSHDYTLFQEVQRYFDYGVFHSQQPELVSAPGSAEGEGIRFVLSELRYMASRAPLLLPLVPLRNAAKYLGYRLGLSFEKLPLSIRRRLSMTRGYWNRAVSVR